MAFQDFDELMERRHHYRRQEIRRRSIIASVVTVVILIAVAVVCVVLRGSNQQDSSNEQDQKESLDSPSPVAPNPPPAAPSPPSSNPPSPVAPKPPSPVAQNPVEKEVRAVCAGTDYVKTCEDRLPKALGKNDLPTPNDFAKAAVLAPSEEIKMVAQKASGLKYTDSTIKQAAVEDCLELLNDAVEELNKSIASVQGMDLTTQAAMMPDLNNQLSAALAHQETCTDGFPDGKEKDDMEILLKDAKELSRNALAIVSRAGSASKEPQRKLLGLYHNEYNRRLMKQDESKKNPDVIVAKDRSGMFDTISAALKAMPQTYTERYVIYIKEGVYEENIVINKKMVNITIRGDGSEKTMVSGSKNYADGVTVYQSTTFAVLGEGFMAKSIGFRNTAGPEKQQAVALRVQADHSIFIDCRIEGYQNVLFTQSQRQFYRSCDIFGTVDIIFGDAAAVFQNCMIHVRKPLANQSNTVTAQGRLDKRETTGIVIHNSHILADNDLEPEKKNVKSYLGRPGKECSRAVIMETQIGKLIRPEGWLEETGSGSPGVNTVYYAEFENKGAGAGTSGRVKWLGYKVIAKEEAANFTVSTFLQGDGWIKSLGVPVRMGLYT